MEKDNTLYYVKRVEEKADFKVDTYTYIRTINIVDLFYTFHLLKLKLDPEIKSLNSYMRIVKFYINKNDKAVITAFICNYLSDIVVLKYDIKTKERSILIHININELEKDIHLYHNSFNSIKYVTHVDDEYLTLSYFVYGNDKSLYEAKINLKTGDKKYEKKKILNCDVLCIQRINENFAYFCKDENDNHVLIYKDRKLVISLFPLLIYDSHFVFNHDDDDNYIVINKYGKRHCLYLNKWTDKKHHLFPLNMRNMIFNFICIMYNLSNKGTITFNRDIVLLIIEYLMDHHKDNELEYNLSLNLL